MNTIDHATRYGVEYRAPRSTRWILLGTAGTHAEASRWLTRFGASGDFRVRHPRKEAARA